MEISKRQNIKGLLFDKDGTLFDYHSTWGPWAYGFINSLANGDLQLAKIIANALEYDPISHSFRPESQFIAGTTDQVLQTIHSAMPNLSLDQLEQRYRESTAQATLNPPVSLAPFLKTLKQSGKKIGLATNDHEATAYSHLQKAGVVEYFDFIAGFDSGFGAKPDPGMQHGFCKTTGLQPNEIAMVGDSLHDLVSGNRAGMITIGVLTGVAKREELETHASVVLKHIGEIPAWLNS